MSTSDTVNPNEQGGLTLGCAPLTISCSPTSYPAYPDESCGVNIIANDATNSSQEDMKGCLTQRHLPSTLTLIMAALKKSAKPVSTLLARKPKPPMAAIAPAKYTNAR